MKTPFRPRWFLLSFLVGSAALFFIGPAVSGKAVQPTTEAEGLRASIRDALATASARDDGRNPPGPVGMRADVGPSENPKKVSRLRINRPGVYENYLVDGEWESGTLVKISADGVVLRNCEIRNGTHNAVTVEAEDVLIENCHIHHVLKGTFDRQDDAHGVTGRPRRLIVRNCDIHHVSGDALQFDPGRGSWGDVLVESCTLWTSPLEQDAAGFRRGERPGENAVDTKADPENGRSRLIIRDCYLYGWGDGQIAVQAALNLKESVTATVENCVFRDNDVCFRLRGDTGRGNADVTILRCAIYDSKVGIRTEDRLANLRIDGLGFGGTVGRRIHIDRGKIGPGFSKRGESAAPPLETALERGVVLPGG